MSITVLFLLYFVLTFGHCGAILFEDFTNKSFVTIWNAPSNLCERKFGIKFNLSRFDIIANTNDSFRGNEVVIFYRDQLGLYPYIREDGGHVNGGLPQNGDIAAHLRKAQADVNRDIPDAKFSGLAVIDWEEWRPIFDRNLYSDRMKIYVQESEDLVRAQHPDWSENRVTAEARFEFEEAARHFMESTMELCRRLRPRAYWGYYGFPNCYIHRKGQTTCSNDTIHYNDKLSWMFAASSALLPSIYLNDPDSEGPGHSDLVRGQLREAVRLVQTYGHLDTAIVPYTRFRYRGTGNVYSKGDLSATIRQVALAGMNGVVLWENSASFESYESCALIGQYVNNTLGPYVENQTELANQCAKENCNSHGRCVEKSWPWLLNKEWSFYRDILKFLSVLFIDIIKSLFKFDDELAENVVLGRHWTSFRCHCHGDWVGSHCQKHNNIY